MTLNINTFFYLFLLLLLMCFSCNLKKESDSSNEKDSGNHTVENKCIVIKDAFDNISDEFLLSDIGCDIEIIPLKFNDKYLFHRINKICVDDNNIFVMGDLSRVLRYNRKGEFVNKIGSLGEGPEDYSYCFGISLDTMLNRIYIASGLCAQNQIKSYSYSGDYINSITVAPKGYCMLGSEHDFYDFRQNVHIFRRMLPLTDGGKDIWLIQIQDTAANVLASFYNSVDLDYIDEINKNSFDWENFDTRFWAERSPVCSFYKDETTFVFEGNDTVYRYDSKNRKLDSRYILDAGVKHNIREERKAVKSYEDCLYMRVEAMFETSKYIYITVEKETSSFLIRYEKNSGEICAIENKGEILSGGINKTHFRSVESPGLKNDLCGGIPFYPDFRDGERLIKVYTPEELIEKIDIEDLKIQQVLMPEKKEMLLSLLHSLKNDDNPVIMIVTLK